MIMQNHQNRSRANRLRSGERKYNWSRSSTSRIWPLSGHGAPSRHLSLSGGIKRMNVGFSLVHVRHFGDSRSASGIPTVVKLKALEKFMGVLG